MNCAQARSQLPDWLYGDLAPTVLAQFKAHLAECADCRREGEALRHVRQALDSAPAVKVDVDLSKVYAVAAQAQARRLRQWRRGAAALGGLAAGLALFAVLPALEFRGESHQFVVRWGSPPSAPRPPAPAPIEPARVEFVAQPAADVEERLEILSNLVQALADDADARDTQRGRDLAALRNQVNELRDTSRLWRISTERDVAALYAVQFSETKKGN